MPELVAPTVRLHAAWLDAQREWGPGLHEDGFGLRPSDEVDSPAGFAAVDNIASAKTIERCGGVPEDVRDTELGPTRRYWIST